MMPDDDSTYGTVALNIFDIPCANAPKNNKPSVNFCYAQDGCGTWSLNVSLEIIRYLQTTAPVTPELKIFS